MKIREKNKIFKKEAVKFSKTIILALLLITSVFFAGIPTINADNGSRAPKTIWGYVTYCNGGVAVGASVVVHATGYPDEADTTGSLGEYQVDIGADTGTEWPTGTSFTVTATKSGWSGSSTGTVSGSATRCDVTLNPPTLVADANANPTTVVVGETVSFTGSATGGATPYTWDWDFGDGSAHSSLQNPTHSYSTTGSKTVVLTVTDACIHTDTDNVVITVNPALDCDANGPYTGTKCNAVQFTGTTTGGHPGYSWDWNFGDSTAHSSLQNPTHLYANDGSYTATLTVTDSQLDTAVDTAPVTISTLVLVAEAAGPYTGCTSQPVSFSGSASGGCTPYSYSWTFGDGGGSNQQNPSHTYSSPGVYTVTLTITDNSGHTAVDTSTATIVDCLLNIDAHGPYYGEVGELIQFTGSVSGGTAPYYYQWSFGDGSIGEVKNPTHAYSEPSPTGGYQVILYVSDSKGTSGQDQTRVHVTGDLIADAGGPYYKQVGELIQFSGSASGGTVPYMYSWDFDKSDGIQEDSTLQNPTHTYVNEGEYIVTLTVTDDDGKSAFDETTAIVGQDIPVPDLECEGTLSWNNVVQGTTVNDTFTVINNGDSGSKLNWEIDSYPQDWGTWTFTPSEEFDLTPEDGEITVLVTLVAPKVKNLPLAYSLVKTEEYTGNVTIINKDNPSDKEVIPVSITVSKNKAFTFFKIYEYLLYRFPFFGKILDLKNN